MQISLKKNKDLEHQLTIQIPAQMYDDAFNARLKSISQRVKVPGFRPGKVPLSVLRQKYGREVHDEVLDDLVNTNYKKAILQEKLKPAGYPKIDTRPLEKGKDFEFTATFEVYPEFKIGDLSKLKLNQPEVTLLSEDVDNVLQDLRNQRAEWIEVDRKAQQGDKIEIDFEGSIDGEPFEGGKAEKKTVEIGAQQMIEDFEKQLIGFSARGTDSIKVKFPKDYQNPELAGKKATFKITVHKVMEKKLPELDAHFIKSFGVEEGDIDSLKNRLKEHLEKELEQNIRIYLKNQVMDRLAELHPISVPRVLVDAEIDELLRQMMQRFGVKSGDTSKFPRDPFEEKALRRVKLGLILGQIVKENKIQADSKRIREHIEQLAAQYQDPASVVKHYYANKELLQGIESLFLEEAVVDWALGQAKVTGKKMDFNTLIKENRAK